MLWLPNLEYIEIQGRYFVTVTKRHPCFKFELDGQGRAISFEPMLEVLATETRLHWTASSDDVAVLDALLDAGADIESPGSVIGTADRS